MTTDIQLAPDTAQPVARPGPAPARALGATVIGAAAIAAALLVSGQWRLALLAVSPALLELWVRPRLRLAQLSPVYVLVWLLALVGLGGSLLASTAHPSTLVPDLTASIADRTSLLFAATCLFTVLGAAAGCRHRRPRSEPAPRWFPLSPTARRNLALGALSPLVIVAVSEPASYLLRDTYLRGDPGDARYGLTGPVFLGSLVCCGGLWRDRRSPTVTIGVMALLDILGLFALGSRQFALAPIAFAVGLAPARAPASARRILLAAVALSLLLLPVPLYLRGLPSHGLLPYASAMPAMPFEGGGLGGAVTNVTDGFDISGRTAYESAPIGTSALLVSVNPLPGRSVGWYSIARRLRINQYVPFSAVGELGNLGWAAVAGAWLAIGYGLAVLDGRLSRLLDESAQLIALTALGLTYLFCVKVIQYNLRSSLRLLYAALAVAYLAPHVREWLAPRRQPPRAPGR